jgi:acyl carrier protein
MYAAQVQWQLNCASANKARLYFYLRGKRPISTGITRNDAFIAKAEERALWFWNLIQTKTPPPLVEGRDKVVYELPVVDNTWAQRVVQYREKASYLEDMEAKVKAVKADLKQLEQYFTEKIPSDVQTFDKDGIRATRVDRTGSIDYPKLVADLEKQMGIKIGEKKLESYRKKGTSYFRVSVTDDCQDVQSEQPKQEAEPTTQVEYEAVSLASASEVIAQVLPEVASKLAEVEEPKKDVEPEIVHPLPASNFFEKSTSNVFF